MSEIIEQPETKAEFPKKGQSGNGTTHGYTVEARYTAGDHVVINGVVYTDKWKQVNPDRAAIGVPTHRPFESWLHQCNLMNYPAAQAIRWWFHAIAEQDFHNICLETRLIKHEIKYSYSETDVSEHCLITGEDRSSCMPDWGKK